MCTKRHIKPCKYVTNCKKIEKCECKHTESQNSSSQLNQIAALQKTVKDLLEYKNKSKAQIEELKKEMNTFKSNKSNKTVLADLSDKALKIEKLQDDFKLSTEK